MGTPLSEAATGCWLADADRSCRSLASHLFQSSLNLLDSLRSSSMSSWSIWSAVAESLLPIEFVDRLARDFRIM